MLRLGAVDLRPKEIRTRLATFSRRIAESRSVKWRFFSSEKWTLRYSIRRKLYKPCPTAVGDDSVCLSSSKRCLPLRKDIFLIMVWKCASANFIVMHSEENFVPFYKDVYWDDDSTRWFNSMFSIETLNSFLPGFEVQFKSIWCLW